MDNTVARRLLDLEEQVEKTAGQYPAEWRLGHSLRFEHVGGGGALMYAWNADSIASDTYIGSQQFTSVNIAFDDFAATTGGGPYADFDGSTEALYIADASWQEPAANPLLVWHWCRTTTVAAQQTVVGKYAFATNDRSWRLLFDNTVPGFTLQCNATGSGSNVTVDSVYAVAINTWYFVAGYYNPSTLMRIYVGAATDTALTVTSRVAGVPASLYNGTAPLAIGASFSTAPTLANVWSGLIGVGGARVSVPGANIDKHVTRLFHQTRRFYQ